METVVTEQPPSQAAAPVQAPIIGAEIKPVMRKQRSFQSRPLFEDKEKPIQEATTVAVPDPEMVLDPSLETNDIKISMSVRVSGRTVEIMKGGFTRVTHAVTPATQGIFMRALDDFMQEAQRTIAAKVNEKLMPEKVAVAVGDEPGEEARQKLPKFTGDQLSMHISPKVDLSTIQSNGSDEV